MRTARTYTSDDDVRVALLGDRAKVRTEKPWLRVDLALRAALGSSQLLQMPTPATWKAWAVETISRLDSIERLIPEKDVRERKDGLEILAWKDTPEVTVHCEADGNLYLLWGLDVGVAEHHAAASARRRGARARVPRCSSGSSSGG